MLLRDCSFRGYRVYADIRYGSDARINIGVVERDQFSMSLVALSSELLKTGRRSCRYTWDKII